LKIFKQVEASAAGWQAVGIISGPKKVHQHTPERVRVIIRPLRHGANGKLWLPHKKVIYKIITILLLPHTWSAENPRIGGLEQDVTNLRNLDCSSIVISLPTICHSHLMTRCPLE
jgi:hypothetical protein